MIFEFKKTEGGTTYLETECPKKSCGRPYRMDELHPEYARIKAALEAGDRSSLRCYHSGAAT